MTRSLRSRLIFGMLSGMALLLVAADVTIYTVQRRQLYRAFDDALLSSANALALLVRPGPFGVRFDAMGLTRLPAGRIHEGALYQLWSDRPIHRPPPMPDPNSAGGGIPTTGPSPDEYGPSRFPFPGPHGPPGIFPDWQPGKPPEHWPKEWEDANAGDALVLRSSSLNGADLPRLAASSGQPCFEDITLPDGRQGRAVGLQFSLPDPAPEPIRSSPTELTAVVAAGIAEVEKQLSFLAALLVATALGTMAVSGAVAWLVVSRGLYPLATVAGRIAAMDETDLKQRIADRGVPREIEPVVNQLNGLLGRLDEAFDRERTLTADVAHELRTPVAEIRAITEVALTQMRDPEEYRQALDETLDTAKTLQELIEKLLVLARLEARQMKPELEPLALKALLARQWAQVRSRAEPRGITFEDRCPADTIVSADPRLLEVVLSNVLANAAAYALDGGCITAEAERVGARCRLTIANSGCELSESEVAKVFDRFWRADAARSKTGLNCGLGLTLVRRAMEAMGGSAEASVSHDRRFILTLAFDAAELRV